MTIWLWRLDVKKETLLKVAGPKLKIYINGHPINIWVDSGLPMSILTLDDLKKTDLKEREST